MQRLHRCSARSCKARPRSRVCSKAGIHRSIWIRYQRFELSVMRALCAGFVLSERVHRVGSQSWIRALVFTVMVDFVQDMNTLPYLLQCRMPASLLCFGLTHFA